MQKTQKSSRPPTPVPVEDVWYRKKNDIKDPKQREYWDLVEATTLATPPFVGVHKMKHVKTSGSETIIVEAYITFTQCGRRTAVEAAFEIKDGKCTLKAD